jgi:hypothetical protein
MYERCFQHLNDNIKWMIKPTISLLIGFSREVVQPLGELTFPVVIRRNICFWKVEQTFFVVDTNSAHNVILGRPALRLLGAVFSTAHGMVRFPTPYGIATVRSEVSKRVIAINYEKEGVNIQDASQNQFLLKEKWVINLVFPNQQIEVGAKLSMELMENLFSLFKGV